MADRNKITEYAFILIIVAFGLFYTSLALNTQMLGEDEAGYFSLAKDFMRMEYPKAPYAIAPLTSLIYVPFFYLFGATLGVAKAVISIFGILTLLLIYAFCKKVDKTSFFGINIFGMASISVMLTISYFTHFMLISYGEIPMAFFSILFLYLLVDMKTPKDSIGIGAVMGLAFLEKATALLFPLMMILFAFSTYIHNRDKNNLKTIKLAFLSCLVFFSIFLVFVARNMILYNFPFVEGLDSFFMIPSNLTSWGDSQIVKTLSIPVNLFDVFGYISIFLSVFGIIHSIETKNRRMLLTISFFFVFLAIFFLRSLLGTAISDPRYFSFVFPEIAILGGYYISKVVNYRKYAPVIIVAFLVFSLSVSMSVASSTQSSQRYPTDYVSALTWLKQNTNNTDLVFTAYGGSLKYYAERDGVWSFMKEFPEIMTTSDSNRIYNLLSQYNISYILIWRGILSESYIIPGSNINGVFTYNFLSVIDSDKEHFTLVHSEINSNGQQDDLIYRVNR